MRDLDTQNAKPLDGHGMTLCDDRLGVGVAGTRGPEWRRMRPANETLGSIRTVTPYLPHQPLNILSVGGCPTLTCSSNPPLLDESEIPKLLIYIYVYMYIVMLYPLLSRVRYACTCRITFTPGAFNLSSTIVSLGSFPIVRFASSSCSLCL